MILPSATAAPIQFPIVVSLWVNERSPLGAIYFVRKAILEVNEFFTSALNLSKVSCEFCHELSTGEAEERSQEDKMKLHIWGLKS
jgi:hypothetical protein